LICSVVTMAVTTKQSNPTGHNIKRGNKKRQENTMSMYTLLCAAVALKNRYDTEQKHIMQGYILYIY